MFFTAFFNIQPQFAMDVSMPSDDEQPHDSIRKRDVDPKDSERLQLYWYSQIIQKQPKKNYHCGSIPNSRNKAITAIQLRNTHHQTTIK